MLMEYVLQERPPQRLSYGGSLGPTHSLSLSLSLLLRRVSPSGTWGKSSEPSTAVKADNLRNWGQLGGLY
jgi:hypothetical protein